MSGSDRELLCDWTGFSTQGSEVLGIQGTWSADALLLLSRNDGCVRKPEFDDVGRSVEQHL